MTEQMNIDVLLVTGLLARGERRKFP